MKRTTMTIIWQPQPDFPTAGLEYALRVYVEGLVKGQLGGYCHEWFRINGVEVTVEHEDKDDDHASR
jgi:hypothetical protein